MIRRSPPALLALAPLGFAPAQAADVRPDSTEGLATAQNAGKPILATLGAEPRFEDLQVFDVDFDTRKPAPRGLCARMQGTLTADEGERGVGRSVGVTQPEWIEGSSEKVF